MMMTMTLFFYLSSSSSLCYHLTNRLLRETTVPSKVHIRTEWLPVKTRSAFRNASSVTKLYWNSFEISLVTSSTYYYSFFCRPTIEPCIVQSYLKMEPATNQWIPHSDERTHEGSSLKKKGGGGWGVPRWGRGSFCTVLARFFSRPSTGTYSTAFWPDSMPSTSTYTGFGPQYSPFRQSRSAASACNALRVPVNRFNRGLRLATVWPTVRPRKHGQVS